MKLLKKNKGFTVVELVIVIGVIAVLSAILIPTFVNVTENAKKSKRQSELASGYNAYVADAVNDGGKLEGIYLLDDKGTAETEDDEYPQVALAFVDQEDAIMKYTDNKYYQFDGKTWAEKDVTGLTIKMVAPESSDGKYYKNVDTTPEELSGVTQESLSTYNSVVVCYAA